MLGLGFWFGVKDGDPRVIRLYEQHYSADPTVSTKARICHGVSGVGESMVLLTPTSDAAFIWVKNTIDRMDGQTGVQCSFFRNESPHRASALIREARELAWSRWLERVWTYVNPAAVQSEVPGYSFRYDRWKSAGYSKKGLLILERRPH